MLTKSETKNETFDQWAILELFGHQRMAGRVTEMQIGGASFVRVDVYPPTGSKVALTRLLNPSAIYALTPVTEETARTVAKGISVAPVTEWDVRPLVEAASRRRLEDGDDRA